MPRYLLPIALILCLGTPGAPLHAAQGPRKTLQRPPVPVQAAPSDALGRLWHHFTALWGAEGCGIDPSGVKCAASPTGHAAMLPPAPEGCGIDPDGFCSR